MLMIRLICRFSKCSVEIKQKGMVQDLLDVAILSIGTFDMNRLFFQVYHSSLLQRFYACPSGNHSRGSKGASLILKEFREVLMSRFRTNEMGHSNLCPTSRYYGIVFSVAKE